jgi:pimeloyl-ACP methyl ester carboxylesterase
MPSLPVLFLPGTLCTGAVFTHQVTALERIAPQVGVVQFKYEGHVDEMAELVEQRIPTDSGAALVGFSMGGMVALAVARRHPGLVKKLALLNSNSHAETPERHAERMQHLEDARQNGIGKALAEHYLPNYLHRPDESSQRLILKMAEQLGTDVFEAQIDALATRPDSGETLDAIHCQTLILGGARDALCPAAHQFEMSRRVRGADLLLLASCGHFSTLERPQAVSRALIEWYRE